MVPWNLCLILILSILVLALLVVFRENWKSVTYWLWCLVPVSGAAVIITGHVYINASVLETGMVVMQAAEAKDATSMDAGLQRAIDRLEALCGASDDPALGEWKEHLLQCQHLVRQASPLEPEAAEPILESVRRRLVEPAAVNGNRIDSVRTPSPVLFSPYQRCIDWLAYAHLIVFILIFLWSLLVARCKP
jgi:hypothetical protein